jgi:hypothetical protein
LLGSGSEDDRCEEAILFGPPSRTVGISLPSEGQKRRHLGVLQAVPGWMNSAIPISGSMPEILSYHGYKLHMAPYSTPAGFRELEVDYNVFPFSSNPSASHYFPPCIIKLQGWQWSIRLFGVYGVYMNQD